MYFLKNCISEISLLFIITLAIAASYWDIRCRKIPNKLTFPMMLVGVIIGLIHTGYVGLVTSLKGLAIGFAILFAFYITIGGVGEGDIKLLAAFGALGGPAFVTRTAVYGIILGGVYAILCLAFKKKLTATIKWAALSLLGLFCKGFRERIIYSDETMPYGPFLALGAILSLIIR
jgi:prepilin peptidase CpaA